MGWVANIIPVLREVLPCTARVVYDTSRGLLGHRVEKNSIEVLRTKRNV
jgi:hypothetical protein